MDKYVLAADLLLRSKYTVILTGAGVSTESGIPDFRSPGRGLWENIDPMEVLSTKVLFNKPDIFYKTGFKLMLSMKNAKPNKAHSLIAKLEEDGYIKSVITQNIDNLHCRAGSKCVYEVHGNTRTCTCMSCRRKYKLELIEQKVQLGQIPPLCRCGGVLRPDVVLFGDMLPQCFNYAVKEVEHADLLIVAGSSLTVSPVNYLAGICKRLIIINIGETPFDYRAEVLIRDNISEAFEGIVNSIMK